VFGMMLDADVATIEPQSTVVAAASAHVDLTLEDRFVIRLGVHMGVVAATAVAARLTGADPSKVSDEDRATVAGEVSNLLMARLHASFSERSLKSEVSTSVQAAGGGQVKQPWTARAAHRPGDFRRRRVLRVAAGPESGPRGSAVRTPGSPPPPPPRQYHRRVTAVLRHFARARRVCASRLPCARSRSSAPRRSCWRLDAGERPHVTAGEECSCDHSTGVMCPMHRRAARVRRPPTRRGGARAWDGSSYAVLPVLGTLALPERVAQFVAGSPNPPLHARAPRRPVRSPARPTVPPPRA
jgi:hypothetical protein